MVRERMRWREGFGTMGIKAALSIMLHAAASYIREVTFLSNWDPSYLCM
jgi:hypothetical protein